MKLVSSLTNRIFLASAALTVLCISTAIYVVNARVTAAAEDELRRELVQTGAVVDQQRATVSDLFAALARMVADLPKLKAAVDTKDAPTVEPIAAEYQRGVNADLFLVTDRSGRALASLAHARAAGTTPGGTVLGGPGTGLVQRGFTRISLPAACLASVRPALAGREARVFCAFPDGVLQVVSVPITAGANPPDIIGSLTLGFLFDDALAARFKRLTGSEIAFVVGSRVVASTLPPAERRGLGQLAYTDGVSRVMAGGSDYLALLRPLTSAPGPSVFATTAGAGAIQRDDSRAAVIILRSRTGRLRLLRPIRTALMATGLFAVLLAVALSYAIARTITRPLGAITAVMREMAVTGDLTRKISWPTSRWQDEDAGLLAHTFNILTGSVTRFQREAAERERLSALGRLSTVVAHEVRNPLMIIKASLRPLARGGASVEEIREAAADIDEEVTRLNRLVNDVLDFARPLRFDFAPADINAVCSQSMAAVSETTGRAGLRVNLVLDRSVAPVVTDGERLRSALVNILVNAHHAVAARRAEQVPAGSLPEDGGVNGAADIELRTALAAGGRVAITVQDRGVGIQPADLPRVFEPYFTTKRTGSGLGLAIARNIVQGLGGTIRVSSQPGLGTEIRIELPERPAPGIERESEAPARDARS